MEQILRYLSYLRRDPLLVPVEGMLACLSITAQARTLAHDRGIAVKIVDYDDLRGIARDEMTLF